MKTHQSTINPQSLAAESGAQLLDVRTPAEFEEAHIAGSKLAPLDRLDADQVGAAFDTERPVYVVCRTGNRASQAIGKLKESGTECVLLDGGIDAWLEKGLPVNRGRKAISLERQVRIAAGALVVLGSGLSLLNPYFLILPAFVGAGLAFAGITDTCGMAMLLARMPWNRRGKGSAAAACSICRADSPASA